MSLRPVLRHALTYFYATSQLAGATSVFPGLAHAEMGCVKTILSEAAGEEVLTLEYLSNRKQKISVHLKDVDSKQSRTLVPSLVSHIDRANVALERRFVVPEGVELRLSKFGTHSMAISSERVLEISLSPPVTGKQLAQHPGRLGATIIHEYGHLVFGESIPKYSSVWGNRKLRTLLEDRGAFDRWIEASNDKARIRDQLQTGDATAEMLKTAQEKVDRARAHSQNTYRISVEARDTEVPYQEFFSDLLTTIVTQDSAAMQRSLPFRKYKLGRGASPEEKRQARKDLLQRNARSFDSRVRPEAWVDGEEHALFVPARAHLWRKLISRYDFRNNGGELLEKVIRAMAADLDDIARNPSIVGEPVSQRNKRLIEKLELEFSSGGQTGPISR